MEGCKHCELGKRCPLLNKSECPVLELWRLAEEATATVAEAEQFLLESNLAK